MILNLNTEVRTEMLDSLIKSYNELKENESLEIYLNTMGGEESTANTVIDIINRNSYRTKLWGVGVLASAGFDIFFKVKCYRELIEGVMGMAHNAKSWIHMSGGVEEKSSVFFLEKLAQSNSESLKFYKHLGLTNEELKRIKNNEDVWLSTDRMKALLKNQIVNQ